MIGEINRFNLTILVDLNYLGIRSAYRFQQTIHFHRLLSVMMEHLQKESKSLMVIKLLE